MSNTVTYENGNFTSTPNELLAADDISLAAKGLYGFMRSKPQGWNFTIRSMAKQLKEGQDAISTALQELRSNGWVDFKRNADGTGEYFIRWKPTSGKPTSGKPTSGFSGRISNKDSSNKDSSKNDLSIPPNPQGGSADAPEPAPAQKPRKAIPFEQIKNLFNEILPELPTVILINKSREASIRARWNEHQAHQSLEFWEDLFIEIRKSDFLMGRTLNSSSSPFRLTFDWLLKPSNFVKVVEGNYHG